MFAHRSHTTRCIAAPLVATALGVAGLAACADQGSAAGAPTAPVATDPSASAQGTLSVALTDDPFPFDSVARADIYVVRIDARRADSDSATAERGKDDDHKPGESEHGGEHQGSAGSATDTSHHSGSTGSDTSHHDGGGHGNRAGTTGVFASWHADASPTGATAADSDAWVTVAAPNARINLLDLQGGKTAALGQQALVAGTYRGFRIIINVDSSSVTLKSGKVLTSQSRPGIRWPSAGRTGIKVTLDQPVTIVPGGAQLVFDFDLGRSFALHGTSPGVSGLEFKPVIRAMLPATTGAVSGTVRDSASGRAISGASVEVLRANTLASDTTRARLVATAATGERGIYTAAFLAPGHYALQVTGQSSHAAHATAFVSDVEVKAGDQPARRDVTLP